jgi:hypothetical protein
VAITDEELRDRKLRCGTYRKGSENQWHDMGHDVFTYTGINGSCRDDFEFLGTSEEGVDYYLYQPQKATEAEYDHGSVNHLSTVSVPQILSEFSELEQGLCRTWRWPS